MVFKKKKKKKIKSIVWSLGWSVSKKKKKEKKELRVLFEMLPLRFERKWKMLMLEQIIKKG